MPHPSPVGEGIEGEVKVELPAIIPPASPPPFTREAVICPSTAIFPLSGCIYHAMSFMSVVLPHQDSPTSAVIVPHVIVRLKCSKMGLSILYQNVTSVRAISHFLYINCSPSYNHLIVGNESNVSRSLYSLALFFTRFCCRSDMSLIVFSKLPLADKIKTIIP